MARKSRQVETRMIAEYLQQNYSAFPFMTAVPLGVVDEKLMSKEGYARAIRMSRPFRPECDAIVILPRHLLIIEAKVWNVVKGLGQLILYKDLITSTPELQNFPASQLGPIASGAGSMSADVVDLTKREVLMQLVVIQVTTNLSTMCAAHGVELKTYSPPWLLQTLNGLDKYWTNEYRAKRQEILDAREYFGVE